MKVFNIDDKVYDIRFGNGIVTRIDNHDTYPVNVKFKDCKSGIKSYTIDGKYYNDENISLFHFERKTYFNRKNMNINDFEIE